MVYIPKYVIEYPHYLDSSWSVFKVMGGEFKEKQSYNETNRLIFTNSRKMAKDIILGNDGKIVVI